MKTIRCIPSQPAQLFMNLLVNAANAMSSRGGVEITTTMENNSVNSEVADNDHGIAPEHVPHIF